MEDLRFSNTVGVSALYFALLNCGYEYSSFERDAEHVNKIKSFRNGYKREFFSFVKQPGCEIYPYWPRASMLEHASFYISNDENCMFRDFDVLQSKIMSATNITDSERNEAFWNWLFRFPQSLSAVVNEENFMRYFEWECEWLDKQNRLQSVNLEHLSKILDFCTKQYGNDFKNIKLLLNPIKCVYSADNYLIDDTFVFCSGSYKTENVVHEFLHHYIHPIVLALKRDIIVGSHMFPGIDRSYYLDESADGIMNAFEEYAVRRLAFSLLYGEKPRDINVFVAELLQNII